VTHDEQHRSWGTEALWHRLKSVLPGLSIEVIERTDSTNSELLARARVRPDLQPENEAALVHRRVERGSFGRRSADAQPCLLVAEHQTGGRGRQGRAWLSERGASLTFSLGLPLAPQDWSGLSLAVGVALAEALDPATDGADPRVRLKWPNDLWLVDPARSPGDEPPAIGRKLGGILIETVGTGGGPDARRQAVIGVGLNVAPLGPLEQQPEWLASFGCLQELDPALTPAGALARVAEPLALALLEFERHGFTPFAERFARRDLLAGRRIRTTSREVPEGMAEGVTAQGALRVRTDAGLVELSVGEVTVRPEGAPVSGPAPLDDGQG
jgi:BirA family transcriptional regulator, biotin operon repressor / biotin---[acetyl-CoA-carboxylase] ligase